MCFEHEQTRSFCADGDHSFCFQITFQFKIVHTMIGQNWSLKMLHLFWKKGYKSTSFSFVFFSGNFKL